MKWTRRNLILSIAAVALVGPLAILANTHRFEVNAEIGQWRQSIPEAVVKEVRMEVKRTQGSDKTYLNARFGKDGTTFEGGRRVQIKGGDTQKIVWKVNQAPKGQDLIINCYDGKVYVTKVGVEY